jgi:glyoxylase-like metal-dependent hydrolase (beta-lactamase superfamily II)
MKPECFEVFAVRYASVERTARENFLDGDDLHEGPGALDFFVWAAVGAERTYIIDTGFSAAIAAKRGRALIRCPTEGLAALGIDAAAVEDVVITHLHYDHVGNFDLFPAATFHLQDKEMAYATGRHMAHRTFNMAFDIDTVLGMVREVYGGRVQFHDGDVELSPGFSLHLIGGHTMGLQVVRLWTRRGWVVLAADASHLYANMEDDRPFPIIFNLGEMVQGFARLGDLADSPRHIVPGHDPLVMARYPAPTAELEGIAVRLDVDPTA